jgi:hypothetical protein
LVGPQGQGYFPGAAECVAAFAESFLRTVGILLEGDIGCEVGAALGAVSRDGYKWRGY